MLFSDTCRGSRKTERERMGGRDRERQTFREGDTEKERQSQSNKGEKVSHREKARDVETVKKENETDTRHQGKE